MKKILIADDNETNLKILNIILQKAGYDVQGYNNSLEVIEGAKKYKPDLILSDINMPEINGFDLCKMIKQEDDLKEIPVIFISALSEAENIVTGFSQGAVDYITKPFKAEEVKVRIATHLKLHELQEALEETNRNLAQKVAQQVKKISAMQMETIFSLAKLAQSRDDDTGKHLERVQEYCYILANKLKEKNLFSEIINDDFIKNIFNASPLHDIGKVGISDLILLKPEPFTKEEFAIMQTHTTIGYDTLNEVDTKFGDNSFIEMGKVIARSHHEKWDGTGYPDKLKGDEIPLAARIMAIADVYDALSTKRIYKNAFSQKKCIEIISQGKGTQFDPVLVDIFIELADEFDNIRKKFED